MEAILFKRTTFLIIATSLAPNSPKGFDLSLARYKRTRELIKALKHSPAPLHCKASQCRTTMQALYKPNVMSGWLV